MKTSLLLVFALGPALLGPTVRAALLVVPANQATTEGSGLLNSAFLTYDSPLGMRYQQIMDANQFPAGPIQINGFSVRPDVANGIFNWDWTMNVDFRLSTTPTQAAAMSQVFASNVGDPLTPVLAGAVHFTSASLGGGVSPQPFNIQVPFSTPFLYDPAQGSLLLDARFTGNGTHWTMLGPALDFHYEATPQGVAFAYSNEGWDPTAYPQANNWGYGGLIIQFDYAPVPEPQWGAGLAGLALVGWALVRRRKTNTTTSFSFFPVPPVPPPTLPIGRPSEIGRPPSDRRAPA